MNEKHLYRAHRIDLVLLETMRGRFRWIAFVDGEHMGVGPEALTCIVQARQDALRLAQSMVDVLEACHSTAAPSRSCEATGAPASFQPSGAMRPSAA